MTPQDLDEQLTKYLTDAHSIEEQALIQMRMAPNITGDRQIAAAFEQHRAETEAHETMVRRRLEAHQAKPAVLKEIAGKLTGAGFALFAKFQPDSSGKLVAHAYSYEHLELAAYDLLAKVASRAGDGDTQAVAEEIRGQEEAMAERLEGLFDQAAEASLREHPREDLEKLLIGYLTDAHALEAQAVQLLQRGQKIAGDPELSAVFEAHLAETREHERLVEARLQAHGASRSLLKDAALSLGALNWGGFFAAQPDTPAKLAGFAYAYEHLEIGGYELLQRVAQRAGDTETAGAAQTIIAQERAAAERIRGQFGGALSASLRAQGLPQA